VTTISKRQTYVDYKKVKRLRIQLAKYLDILAAVDKQAYEQFSQQQKLAYLINLYNAFTIDLVARNYPVKSIKKIGPWYSTPWKMKFIKFQGEKVSLDYIEHDIIRTKFKEPRIHFAVNCASIGCPSLAIDAFTGDKLDAQLEQVAINFITNRNKNYLQGNTLYLSKIFDWYGGDFGDVKKFVGKYIKLPNKLEIEYNDYDWKLNGL
jgi:hypothetical protein